MSSVLNRDDVHRPSVIEPEEYSFVGVISIKDEWELAAIGREAIKKHMELTGGVYSRHFHGGSCHICGAHATYLACYYHNPSGVYIRVGQDCAEKIDTAAAEQFRAVRKEAESARNTKAGKKKARQLLIDRGLERAFDLYEYGNTMFRDNPCPELVKLGAVTLNEGGEIDNVTKTYSILRNVIENMIKYGSDLSDKQDAYVRKLIDLVDNQNKQNAARIAEREAAKDCPNDRLKITGEVLSIKAVYSMYGYIRKMLVRDDRGFKVFGTVPSCLDVSAGDRVEFMAAVEQSKDDSKFGFFKRPTKGKLL